MMKYATRNEAKLTRKQDVEAMLRDIALVLRLSQKVKASILADKAMPTGGRFAESQPTCLEIEEMANV